MTRKTDAHMPVRVHLGCHCFDWAMRLGRIGKGITIVGDISGCRCLNEKMVSPYAYCCR